MMKRSGLQQARAEHRVDVLGVGADRGDEAARAFDSDAAKDVFVGRVGLDREEPVIDGRLHPIGIALNDDKGDLLPRELARDDFAHTAEAAEDEMVFQLIEHARAPPALDPLDEIALGEQRHEEREGVEERANAAQNDQNREHPPGLRERVHLSVADRRDGDDRHVEGVPEGPPFDDDIAEGAGGKSRGPAAAERAATPPTREARDAAAPDPGRRRHASLFPPRRRFAVAASGAAPGPMIRRRAQRRPAASSYRARSSLCRMPYRSR